MTSIEIVWRINAIVTLLSTQLEMLIIQSVRELNERNSCRSTEENVASDQSSSSDQRSDNEIQKETD